MKEYQKRQLVVFVFVFTREALEQLVAQIQTLEERINPEGPELPSVSAASPENSNITQAETLLEERGETDAGGTEEEGGGEGLPGEKSKRENASAVIQRNWREHRERVCRKTARNEEMKQKWSLLICASALCMKDMVMLQSAFRGHLSRESQLKDLLEDLQNKVSAAQTRHMETTLDIAIIPAHGVV